MISVCSGSRIVSALQWRHNGRDGVSNHQPHHCLLKRLLGADQRKQQSSALLTFVGGIHRRPVNSRHKGPVTQKMFLFDDVIMVLWNMISTACPESPYCVKHLKYDITCVFRVAWSMLSLPCMALRSCRLRQRVTITAAEVALITIPGITTSTMFQIRKNCSTWVFALMTCPQLLINSPTIPSKLPCKPERYWNEI